MTSCNLIITDVSVEATALILTYFTVQMKAAGYKHEYQDVLPNCTASCYVRPFSELGVSEFLCVQPTSVWHRVSWRPFLMGTPRVSLSRPLFLTNMKWDFFYLRHIMNSALTSIIVFIYDIPL